MVKITSQPPSAATSSPFVSRSKAVEPVTTIEPERKSTPRVKPFVERRKKNDRRKYSASRGPYDFRCGRDRRKGGGRKGQFIEVEA